MAVEKDGVSFECGGAMRSGLGRPAGARFAILNGSSLEEADEHAFFAINGSRLEEVPNDYVCAEGHVRDGHEKVPVPTIGSPRTGGLPCPGAPACRSHRENVHTHLQSSADTPLKLGDRGRQSVARAGREGNRGVKKESELKKKAPADPFQMGLAAGESCPRRKRVSSIRAEEKIRRQVLVESAAVEAPNKENEIESLFCGLPQRKRSSMECILLRRKGSGAQERPTAHRALQDRTNSPAKTSLRAQSRCENPQRPSTRDGVSSKFFLDDLGFLKNRKRLRKEKKRQSGQYLRLKRKNTHFNQGYTTVSPRKKAVIDLFSCPKTFYQCVRKERAVRFDTENVVSVHNGAGSLQPILTGENDGSSFKWEKDKERVEIVKRVDLGCETSADDFIFRRVDKKIES